MKLEYTWCTVTLIYVVYGCKVGYYGYNCTTQCRYPNFGEKCQKVCNCTEDLCDHRFGCILPQNCNEGYYGHDCISPCRYPNFGKKCQNMCSCQLFDCYHIKGCQNITGSSRHDEDWLEGKQLINIIIVIGNFMLFIIIGILITVYAKRCILKRKQTRNLNVI